jgi:hypothetical protein
MQDQSNIAVTDFPDRTRIIAVRSTIGRVDEYHGSVSERSHRGAGHTIEQEVRTAAYDRSSRARMPDTLDEAAFDTMRVPQSARRGAGRRPDVRQLFARDRRLPDDARWCSSSLEPPAGYAPTAAPATSSARFPTAQIHA